MEPNVRAALLAGLLLVTAHASLARAEKAAAPAALPANMPELDAARLQAELLQLEALEREVQPLRARINARLERWKVDLRVDRVDFMTGAITRAKK